MGKSKKKKKASGDARGYSSGSAAAAAKPVAVSSQTHQGLVDLLEQVQVSSSSSSSQQQQQQQQENGAAAGGAVDTSSKRFFRQVTKLYDELVTLGFDEDQIQQGLQAAAASTSADNNGSSSSWMTLETVLDWLCLHLPTEALPALFTEGLVREAAVDNITPSQVTLLQAAATPAAGADSDSSSRAHSNKERSLMEDTITVEYPLASKERPQKESEDNVLALKAWVLDQYQYESDDEEASTAQEKEEDNNETPSPKAEPQPQGEPAKTTTSSSDESAALLVLLPEERRLAVLEQQIAQERASLNDEASNYMRSKLEIKELKKNLSQLESQAKGLRSKVAKLRANQRQEEEKSETAHQSKAEEKNGGGGGGGGEEVGIFSMFDEQDEGQEPKQAAAAEADGRSDDMESEKPPVLTQTKSYSIPPNWTGKSPKKILEEWCQKRKLSRPHFNQLAGGGGRLTVNKQPPLSVSNDGPFQDTADAQQYLSTEALYQLNPDLPLYRLFPPVFRDVWLSWVKEAKAQKEAEALARQLAKQNKIKDLVDSIPKANMLPAPKTPTEVEENSRDDRPVLDSWNDDVDGLWKGKTLAPSQPSALGAKLRDAFLARQRSSRYQKMLETRRILPMHSYRQQFLDAVGDNKVSVLCAETGAGKTTQCPQFLLEEALLSGVSDRVSIVCTQPRRISAMSVAERVAEEMCDRLGDMVGYHVRMEARKSAKTRLLFCTTGVLLRRLQDDPKLVGTSVIVVDEVHERQWQTDFLLIALRTLIHTTRPDLKVILMSATLDSKLFCSFFEGAPLLSVPGRTFPVANYHLEDLLDATDHIIEEGSRYAVKDFGRTVETASLSISTRGGNTRQEIVALECESYTPSDVSDNYPGYKIATRKSLDRVDEQVLNYDLIEDLLELLLLSPEHNETLLPPEGMDVTSVAKGAILVFLPGLGEIRCLTERLTGSRVFSDERRFDIIPMHSTLSPRDQRRAFVAPRKGCQKIILSTNIAETSVTIPDVVCVIDSGLVREVRQDKRSATSALVMDWCSKASAKQRSGRAGRVQPGLCLKLFSSQTAQRVMKQQAMPELQRVPLEEVCLSILAGRLAKNCMEFLLQAPQPPKEDTVQLALDLLHEVGAIHPVSTTPGCDERLTPLGYHLAKLPVHVRLGKMLIFGALFRCLDKILTVAASLSSRSPFSSFVKNSQQASARHKAFEHPHSDFLTVCSVWDAYSAEAIKGEHHARRFCDKNFLNFAALVEIRDMRRQFLDLLCQIGFVKGLETKIAPDGRWSSFDQRLLSSAYNENGENENVVNAVICAGLYSNVAHAVRKAHGVVPELWQGKERVYIHRSSVNHGKRDLLFDWVVFHEKFATGRVNISSTGPVHPFSLLLFGGTLIVKHLERKVLVDEWIELKVAAQTGVMFRELHRKLDDLLKDMIEHVNQDSVDGNVVIEGIVKLLSNVQSF